MCVTLLIIFAFVTNTLAKTCNYENSVHLTNRTYNGIKYSDSEYFVDNSTGFERGCVCMKELCARKCCPFGQGYNQISKKCIDVPIDFNPPVWDATKLVPDFIAAKEFHFLFYKMNCSSELGEARIPIGAAVSVFHLKTNGSLYVEIEEGVSQWYGPDKYCIDHFVSSANDTSADLNALICFTSKPEPNHYMLSSSCMLISCFFIILTLAVYAWLPDLQNLHGLVLMAYLSSFFVGFIFLAIMQILLYWENITGSMCLSFTFVIYFSLLAAFFWLNVMCFDIWWTFSGKRPLSSRPSAMKRRFFTYCVYAFGLPSVMTMLLIILEFSLPPTTSYLLPRIASQGCFLYGRSRFIYLYVPMIILCVLNLIFFILTAVKIAEIKKQTKVLNNQDKQRFSLYIKLFIVMGVNWILEVASSFTDENNIIWRFTDAYNVLVGLIIFIIFVCKKKIWHKIKERIESCSWSNTDEEEMRDVNKNINNKNVNRWKNGRGVRASIDTIKTTLGTDVDSLKSVKSSRIPQSKHVTEENFSM